VDVWRVRRPLCQEALAKPTRDWVAACTVASSIRPRPRSAGHPLTRRPIYSSPHYPKKIDLRRRPGVLGVELPQIGLRQGGYSVFTVRPSASRRFFAAYSNSSFVSFTWPSRPISVETPRIVSPLIERVGSPSRRRRTSAPRRYLRRPCPPPGGFGGGCDNPRVPPETASESLRRRSPDHR
jgi:hypothetical protein